MSDLSNKNGSAFEYICITTLKEEINKYRKAVIEENSAYDVVKQARNSINNDLKSSLTKSASAVILTIFDMEPMLVESDKDTLKLKLQSANEGIKGDVRDIVVSRSGIGWQIGFSLKHNHFAIKHPRIAKNLDFGKQWFNIPCSTKYWEEVKPIFSKLDELKAKKVKRSELPLKDMDIYVPLLNAFKDEILRSYKRNPSMLKRMIQYLLGVGEYDYYKIISNRPKRISQIQSFNFNGTLNKSTKVTKPNISVPIVKLPERIISFNFKPGSKSTLELYMDGWQFSFRLHSAETFVVPSLKFDIQIISMPTTILTIDCKW